MAGWGQAMVLPCLAQITPFCDLLLLYVDGEAISTGGPSMRRGLWACLTLCYTLEVGGWSLDVLSSSAGKCPSGNCQP